MLADEVVRPVSASPESKQVVVKVYRGFQLFCFFAVFFFFFFFLFSGVVVVVVMAW